MKIKPYDIDNKPLIVKELIKKLEELDPDKPLYVSYCDGSHYTHRTPLRLNEIRELNVEIEREIIRDNEDEYNIDWIDTDIVNIEFVECFTEPSGNVTYDDLPF